MKIPTLPANLVLQTVINAQTNPLVPYATMDTIKILPINANSVFILAQNAKIPQQIASNAS